MSAPHNGTETSIEAAESIEIHLNPLESTVLGFIQSRGEYGSTCDEAEKHLGLRHQTCSARFNGLRNKGVIRETERKRKTRSGRNAFVYVVTA